MTIGHHKKGTGGSFEDNWLVAGYKKKDGMYMGSIFFGTEFLPNGTRNFCVY